jgi:YD repeat-containing protein
LLEESDTSSHVDFDHFSRRIQVKTTDPGGHTTVFSYADSWGNTACVPSGGNAAAHLTSTTNALGHVSQSSYNSCTGTVASITDPNNQTTSFTYDLMGRPDITSFPDGGEMDRDYDDAALWMRTKTMREPGAYIVGYSRFDGLGRLVHEVLCEDGSLACAQSIKTDTTYDALEHRRNVSNPYRLTSDPTYGITTFEYDALGRVTKAIPPDGTATSNNVTTVYLGNTTTVIDQAGKQRRSETDALGRVIRVWEPDPSGELTVATSYSYDALDR